MNDSKETKTLIRQAFTPIRADQDLIDRTRHILTAAAGPKSRMFQRRNILRRGLAAAAVVILLAGAFAITGLSLMQKPVAAVSIDINPSIQIDINFLSRVVSVTGYNEAGNSILAKLNLDKLPVKNAVGKIIAAAAQAGYLAKDGSSLIAITSSTDNQSLQSQLEQDTDEAARQALLASGSMAVIYHDNTALARIEEARQLNITPGRLNLIQKLVELDPSQKTADYLTAKASEIMKEVVRLQKEKRDSGKNAGQSAQDSGKENAKASRESSRAARDSHK